MLAEHVPGKSVPETTLPVSVHVLEPVASRSPWMKFPVIAKMDPLVALRSKLPLMTFPVTVYSLLLRVQMPPSSMTLPLMVTSFELTAMPKKPEMGRMWLPEIVTTQVALVPSQPLVNDSSQLLPMRTAGLVAPPDAVARMPAWVPAPCDHNRTELPMMEPAHEQVMPSVSARMMTLLETWTCALLTSIPAPVVDET